MPKLGFWGWIAVFAVIFILVRGFNVGSFFTSFF